MTTKKRSFKFSAKKQALLEAMLKEKGVQSVSKDRIRPMKREGEVPLSFAQQRLWFLHQLEPDSMAYHVPTAVRLSGAINYQALNQTMCELVRRHETLRTTFTVQEDDPLQVIGPPPDVWHVEVVDVTEADQEETHLVSLIVTEAKRPFDLSNGPLLRTKLLRLTSTDHILILTTHHIISDGWSTGIMVEEMMALYLAFVGGVSSPLSELPIQYADFTLWQREWLTGEILEKQLTYWKGQLSNTPPILALPTDYPRPTMQTFRGEHHFINLPPDFVVRLKALGNEQGATLFMVLLAAYQVLLYRHSGQEDILVGTPIANRNRSEVERLIGFFVNTLVMRGDLSGNPGFHKFLNRIRQVAEEAYVHQDLPFERLVGELQLTRDLSHGPLFQVMFALQNTPSPLVDLPNLAVETLEIDMGTAQFDLMLEMWEGPGGEINGRFNYNADLFQPASIQRMAQRFLILLENILANPHQPVEQLPLLTVEEQQRLLHEWNQTAVPLPEWIMLSQVVENQVKQSPNVVALIGRSSTGVSQITSAPFITLTYQQLNQRANQLAHYLQKMGVGPDSLVGICTERSIEMIVGLLAILKAGGAYVPLDPHYPKERLGFIIEDTQTQVILIQDGLEDMLPTHNAQLVSLNTTNLSQYPATNLPLIASGSDLAYIIYTSGSTGRPKGVAISHASAIALIGWSLQQFSDDEMHCVLAATSINFDLSIYEIFVTLSRGGHIVVVENALELPHLPADIKVTLVNTVPSALTELVRTDGIPNSVQVVNLAGEPLKRSLVQRIYEQETVKKVYNLYGPSEDTTYSTWALMLREDARSPDIGRSLSNTQAYILDKHMQPMPQGAPGELYLGGHGLSREYLNRPSITAEKFVPNPFDQQGGSRLYRTGDLVRYRNTGEMEFLGRIDHQVKIRGFRIELGEIEAALNKHKVIRESVVMAHSIGQIAGDSESFINDKRLVAYIVLEKGASLPVDALRTYVGNKLAEYMVPSYFLFLEQFPLTPNGKINRRALPLPDDTRPQLGSEYMGPRTPVEEVLATIWSQVLSIVQVGVHDNFFELGGHSLMATQLISRIREAFDIVVPVAQIFATPTIEGIANYILDSTQNADSLRIPPIEVIAREGELPLSYSQQRMWFMEKYTESNIGANVPMAVRVHGEVDMSAVGEMFDTMIERHEVLRTAFKEKEGLPYPELIPIMPHVIGEIDLQHLPIEGRFPEAQRLLDADAWINFDLTAAPLWRLHWYTLAPDDHILCVNMHHIVSDAWSMGIVAQEMLTLYQAYSAGLPPEVPQLPVQYIDYAHWQRTWLQRADIMEHQMTYWRQHLAGAPTTVDLPTDYPRPPVIKPTGGIEVKILSLELSKAVAAFSRKEGVTLYMTLLAAYGTLIYRYTGQNDILFGSPIANRHHSQIESLIGFFVNTLVMRVNASGRPTYRDLLERVRQMAVGAYTNQDLPFEKLLEELHTERDLSRSPLFQLMFVVQNTPMPVLELENLRLRAIDYYMGVGHFDLSLFISNLDDQRLMLLMEYNKSLFEDTTIRRLLIHFANLLANIMENPDQHVDEIPFLSEAEQAQLLSEWSHVQVERVDERSIHELFEMQATQNPFIASVVSDEGQLTYRDLNEYANQLAHHLQTLGIGSEKVVGLFLERSVDQLVAILAIWKLGAAYLPLDPNYPSARLLYMLQDAQADMLITHGNLDLPAFTRHVVNLTQIDLTSYPITFPQGEVHPDNVAYLIYTSGSTGKPKGVAVRYGALPNFLHTLYDQVYTEIESPACISLNASLSFDASVQQFIQLAQGHTLVIIPEDIRFDPPAMIAYLNKHRVQLLDCTPSHLKVLLQNGLLEKKTHLQYLLVGGEAISNALWTTLAESDIRAYNMYGPTEYTVDTTITEIVGVKPVLGFPVANTHAYVLDKNLRPVPIGIPGELYITGTGLARGYWQRPSITAECFIPNLFAQDGSRLYRTGDVVKYLADGRLQYLDRADHQVKIRGFRVELGEIEAVLNNIPQVKQAVVTVHIDSHGQRYLAAYVVGDIQNLPTILSESLPNYMVPGHFVILDAFPLTPSGKIDRKALPEPTAQDRIIKTTGDTRPRTLTEDLIAQIWADVLDLERVGLHDDFFVLGGHSLMVTQVVSRIRRVFEVDVPVREMFSGPTIAQLAQTVDHAGNKSQRPPIQPVSRENPLPLSYAQQRLWFLYQLEPDSPFYNVPSAMFVQGALNLDVLTRSLQTIIQRHETLRTTFTTVDGMPVQQIRADASFQLTPVAVTAWHTVDHALLDMRGALDEDVTLLLEDAAKRPFNLTTGPLFHILCIQVQPTAHILFINMHHIISDAWSTGRFLQEWMILYSDPEAVLPTLPIQYADFAVWQQNWLQGETLTQQIAYWQDKLGDAPPVLALPTDRPRPPMQTYAGQQVPFTLLPDIASKLNALSREEGVTLFMTLLTVFKVLLYRYTQQEEILVGTPIANRIDADLEPLIGFFDNTLVLRTDIQGQHTFRQILAQVRAATLSAYAHQDLPFERLVEILQPERSLSYTPLFQVLFTLNNTPMPTFSLPELTIELLGIEGHTAKFDLSLLLAETEAGLQGVFEYNTDLFDAETIHRMVGHFNQLVSAILNDKDQSIGQLNWLTNTEWQQWQQWQETTVAYADDAQTLIDLFHAQVDRTPDAVAILTDAKKLTYVELDRKANQLAHYLNGNGVCAGQTVGICLDRTIQSAVAVLAVLKAGATYVPLDPNYPGERLAFIMADAQVDVLLTQSDLDVTYTREQPIYLDQLNLSEYPTDRLTRRLISGEWGAYLMYTSGSTGRPKGVLMPHRPLVNLIQWQRSESQATVDTRTLQFAPLSFDVSCQEMFATWCTGGILVLIPDETRRDATAFLQWIMTYDVNRLFLPFVALQSLAEAVTLTGNYPQSLQEIITAGEQLRISPEVCDLFEALPHCRLINQYGPTEGHVVTAHTLTGAPGMWPLLPPIGKPVANSRVYLLDDCLNPVPIGVPGVLYIGGVSAVHGYWQRPLRTALQFVPDPYTPGARLYCTGDLARYLPDGTIEYLGRNDDQVKIRGFRIELGEVEAIVGEQLHVQNVAVVVNEDIPNLKRLVAYVVAQETTPTHLQQALQATLPDYMVPSAFVMLTELPLTPSGKVNRRALPSPKVEDMTTMVVPPRNSLELQLSRIWETVLGLPTIGVTDNFFALGGHSLLGVRLISRIEQELGYTLPLNALFQGATIAEMAQRIDYPQEDTNVVCLQKGKERPLFLMHPGGGHIFAYVALTKYLDPAQTVYGVQTLPEDHQETIPDMARKYITQIQAIQPEGPYQLGGWSMGGLVAFEMAQQLRAAGYKVDKLILIDTHASQGSATTDIDDLSLIASFAQDMGLSPAQIPLEEDELANLQDPISTLWKLAQQYHLLPADLSLTQLQQLLQAFKRNLKAMFAYEPSSFYDGAILLIRANHRTDHLGWDKYVQELTVQDVTGDHYTLIREPYLANLADKIQAYLTSS